jgi:thiamine biosynthesis lipoprotein
MRAGATPAAGETRVYDDRALGSRLKMTLTGVDRTVADHAWAAVRSEFAAVDAALSGFREDSAVTRLNARAGTGLTLAEPRLYRAVALADRAWRATGGRFDPRVHSALQGFDHPGARAVAGDALSGLGTSSAWLARRPRDRGLAISEPIDLHGLGKGLALRWAWRAVERLVPPGAGGLLDSGGDLVGRAPDPDGGAWLIGIEDPRGGSTPVAVLALAGGSVCTSSTRISRWLDRAGAERHHLIDPVTGMPAAGGLASVTVAGVDAAWCEIRTKELFVLGIAGAPRRARELGLAAWWTTEDGALEMTPLARLVTRWP